MLTIPDTDKSTWQTVRFGDMVHHISERVQPDDVTVDRYVGLEHLDPESLKISRWGSPEEVGATKLRFYPGDIIFGKRRFYQRKLAVADFEGICSAHAMVLRAKPAVVLPEFLPFFMQSEAFFERAMSISVGSLSPTINWSTLQRQEFALPPLAAQRRIAEVLTAVEETIECDKNLLQSVERTKAVKFARMLHDSKCQNGKLSEFTKLITDGDHNPPKRKRDGIPHVVVQNINNGRFDLADCTFISEEDYERVKKRYDPKEGDIILTCVGSIGKLAIVPGEFEFSADRSLAVIRTDHQKLLTEFAFELLQSPMMQKRMEASSIGTAQQHLYLRDIRNLQVEIPGIECQKKILQVLQRFNDFWISSYNRLISGIKLKKCLLSTLMG